MASVNKKMETQGNTTSENKVIEQLWYTWSAVGIDRISAGFRIRAASAGLQDTRSELVKRLNPYQRYLLPQDTDRFIEPSIAPICLTLINTGKERTLVHKVYTGKDGVGRYGAFFIHLLVNLPPEFSVLDAISLWQSSFWKKSDVKDRNTNLERVSLAELRQQQEKRVLDKQSIAQIRKYLPVVLEAYLTKNLLREKQRSASERQQIYIAASDNDVALLISGLIHSLPAQLVQDLTFSTYEQDITAATTEIVGTCWLSLPEPWKDQIVAYLLPPHYYQERLAFNCYTGMSSQVANHPQVLNHPLAAQCAQDATEYFLDRNSSPEFQDLLDTITPRLYPNLSVNEFLEHYEALVVRAQAPSQSDVERALVVPRTPHQYETSGKLLSRSGYQHKFFDLIQNKGGWWESYKKALRNLRQHSAQVPLLAQALDKIALHAIDIVVADIVKKEAVSPKDPKPGNETLFRIMIDVMRCATPPEEEPSVWRALLNELLKVTMQTQHFLRSYRNVYAELIQIWSIALPPSEDNNKLLTPLLIISWSEFGSFLTLRLPLDWVEIATRALLLQSSAPNQEIVHHLEQKYHFVIKNLLEQLSDTSRWPTAMALFSTLITGMYQEKMSLLFILLDSSMGNNESIVKQLLQTAYLTISEKVLFLEKYGSHYLPNNKLSKVLLDMFVELAGHNLHKEKLRVLFAWLDSPRLAIWFDSSQTGEQNLATVLTGASLNIDEIGKFFQGYGKKYITLYPESSTLISLFESYARSGSKSRTSLLNTWFQHNLPEKVLTLVLEAAHLTSAEKVAFLQYYGERYLSLYPQSLLLVNYVREFLSYLWNANIAIFKGSQSSKEASLTEKLLRFLYNHPLPYVSRDLVCDWYNVAQFVRQPSLLRQATEYIAPSIGRLLSALEVQPPMRTDLTRELAVACIANEHEVKLMINNISTVLTLPALVQLLYNIAESAGDGIYRRQYEKTLYVPCIHSALGSKALLSPEAQQEFSVERFLGILLQDADEKTFKWLNTQAKRWPHAISAIWYKFESQRPPPIATSPFERIELFWERTIALTHVRWVLRKEGEKILKVGTDYITTLNNYPKAVPATYWRRLDNVLDIFDQSEEQKWEQYQSPYYPNPVTPSPSATSKPGPLVSWWKRTIALTQVRLALRSGKIGRIVRVATQHIMTLDRAGKRVPDPWWRQIDIAFDIFIALEVEYEESDKNRNREYDIAAASHKLDELVYAKHPTPRLTMHEWRRIKAAVQHIANQDTQKTRDEH